MSTNRTITIGGDASGAVDAFSKIKESGLEAFEGASKAAQNYTKDISEQARYVSFLIDKEKELQRAKRATALQEADSARQRKMASIQQGGGTENEQAQKRKQAQDDYNKSIKVANEQHEQSNKNLRETSRLNQQQGKGRGGAAGGGMMGGGSMGAMAGGLAGFMSGSGVGSLASSVVGGGLGILNSGLGMIGGGVTGALFTKGEKLAKSRSQLMALTGSESYEYQAQVRGDRKKIKMKGFEKGGQLYNTKLQSLKQEGQEELEDLMANKADPAKIAAKRTEIEDQIERFQKAQRDGIVITPQKNEVESDPYEGDLKTVTRVGKRAVVGTPNTSYLGIDRASVAIRQRQLAMEAGTRSAAGSEETAQILRLEKGMGIGEGALSGWSEMQGRGLQSKSGDMMAQFLTLATKSKLWDVDKRDFSAIPREIKTLTAFMQTQSQSMVHPDASQAMSLRAQFAQLDDDKTTGLFAGARGQNLMMGINSAIQSPANSFQSAMTLESIMKTNPNIGGGAVGLMKARAIQQRGLFHGGGSTFQGILEGMKAQTKDPEMRKVLLTTRFKNLLPFVMDKEGSAAMDKMFETDFSTGDMAKNLKKAGFSDEMLTQFKIGTGTSRTEVLNTKIVDKLQTVGQTISESVSTSITSMIDFIGSSGMSKTIKEGIDLAKIGDNDKPKPKDGKK